MGGWAAVWAGRGSLEHAIGVRPAGREKGRENKQMKGKERKRKEKREFFVLKHSHVP